MTTSKVMSFRRLIDEMTAVTEGRQKPTARADKNIYASEAAKSFVSKLRAHKRPAQAKPVPAKPGSSLNIDGLAGVTRLMTRENQALLQIIANGDVTSVADLAARSRRAESNLSRTLKKLEEIGVLKLIPGAGRAKVPRLAVLSFLVNVDVVTGQVTVVSAEGPAATNQGAVAGSLRRSKRTARAFAASDSG